MASTKAKRDHSKLSVTALYTSAAWHNAALPHADLFLTKQAKDVFSIVNGALAVARLFGGETTSLPRSLIYRHATIDDVITKSGIKNILELAAGLSSRGMRMSDDPEVSYIEVDLPHVISFKKNVYMQAAADHRFAPRSNLRFVARDLLDEELSDLVDPGGCETALIVEGFLMYLNDEERQSFFKKCVQLLAPAPGGMMIFDFVPPKEKQKPGIKGLILAKLMKLFTAGRAFESVQKSRVEIRDELLRAGFHSVEFVEPSPKEKAELDIEQLLFVCRLSSSFKL